MVLLQQQVLEQLKSTYTILNQAYETAKIDNGSDANSWYIPSTSVQAAATYFAQNYILPYVKTINVCGLSTASECVHQVGYLYNNIAVPKTYYSISGNGVAYSFTLANGSIVGIRFASLPSNNNLSSANLIYIIFDINGKKLQNVMGLDTFIVNLGGSAYTNKNLFWPYGYAMAQQEQLIRQHAEKIQCQLLAGTVLP